MIMIPVMHSQFRKIPAIKLPTTMRTHMGKQLQRLLSIPAIPLFPGTPGRGNDFIQFIISRLNHRHLHLVIPAHAYMDVGGRATHGDKAEAGIQSYNLSTIILANATHF